MKLTSKRLKQIIKEELENIQQEGMRIPSIKQIMQMDDCVGLMSLMTKLEQAEGFGRSSAEYRVADARFEQVCYQVRGRDEEGNELRPGDKDYDYYPPGFLEENKNNA